MARAATSDPYQSYRFRLVDSGAGFLDADAGFTNVTTPNIQLNAVEYREGLYTWTRKYPGIPTVGDLSCQQGIFRKSSALYRWIKAVIDGGNRDYRTELILYQYHITDEFVNNGTPSRRTTLREVFPMDVKPTGDFAGDDDAIQISEATFAVEEVEVLVMSSTSPVLPNLGP